MDEVSSQGRSWVDHSVLVRLCEELPPGSGICEGFVRDYIGMLPSRVSRLRHAVEAMDQEAAMDAVLSLKISSQMVGAMGLAGLAGSLESELRERAAHVGAVPLAALVFENLLESIDAGIPGTIEGLSSWTG